MLEESSFANRRADYFWLLSLSSGMLLVRILAPFTEPSLNNGLSMTGFVSALQSPIPLFISGLRAHLSLVKTPPVNAYFSIWSVHHNSAVPPFGSCCILVAVEWNVESGGR